MKSRDRTVFVDFRKVFDVINHNLPLIKRNHQCTVPAQIACPGFDQIASGRATRVCETRA